MYFSKSINDNWHFDFKILYTSLPKEFAEKLSNGKTAENDRRNDRNLLILVLKDT